MNRRKELKYFCTEQDLKIIETCLKGIVKKDSHQKGDSYNIRSIYFDNMDNRCFYENDAGVDRRNKYRIRSYDLDPGFIRAEIKTKYRDTTGKDSSILLKSQYDDILLNNHLGAPDTYEGHEVFKDSDIDVLNKYRLAIHGEGFKPAAVIEYERKAFVYDICNVRITFDMNISVSNRFDHFFDKDLHSIPINDKGIHILEIKYDEFLPDYIAQCVDGLNLRRSAFSKYYLGRLKLMEMFRE